MPFYQMEDIAHSMKTLMEEFHGDPDHDVPRPRVISRSYNPSRFRSWPAQCPAPSHVITWSEPRAQVHVH